MRTQANNQNNMRSSSQINQTKPSQPQTKQLRVLDYRNGKYQGITSKQQIVRNGLGILIDDNYSFILGQWKQNKINGPFFMVYPDQSILYGFIENQKIGQILCYQVNKQFNMILSKNSNLVLVDLLPSSSILVFKFDKKFLDQKTVDNILKSKHQKQVNDQINNGFQLLSQQQYANPEQKYKIYQKKLSISNIPQYIKTYELFVKQKFNSTPQKMDLLQILKTKQDLTINFKACAVTLFIKLSLIHNQTKMIGSMNRYENQYEFYRKIVHNSNVAEQYVSKSKGPFTAEYNLNPTIRPKNCAIQLCNYHRGSVTYINQFLNLNYLYNIRQNLSKINQLINMFVTNKLAQVQLQNSRYNQGQESAKKSGSINYTLQQVQQQIYDAVKRKRQSTGKKLYPTISPSRVTEYPQYNRSNQKYSKSQIKNIDTTAKNSNSPYLRALQNQEDIYSSRLNRSKTYLNISNVSRGHDVKATPTKNTQNKSVNQNTASGKKYVYLQDSQNEKFQPSRIVKSPVKYEPYQNMRRLTEAYENIQKQIQLSTPNDKYTRSSYRLDNSIYRKNTVRANEFQVYHQPTALKHTPSQKKVFKYLPN